MRIICTANDLKFPVSRECGITDQWMAVSVNCRRGGRKARLTSLISNQVTELHVDLVDLVRCQVRARHRQKEEICEGILCTLIDVAKSYVTHRSSKDKSDSKNN